MAHPPESIALQAWGMQSYVEHSVNNVQFYLRTGFGDSLEPTCWLGAGNGVAPAVFSAISSMVANAYRQMGRI